MATFDQWFDRFAAYFAGMNDNELKSAWWLYGRDSEKDAPPYELAAWSAVNAEMQSRGI